MPHYDSFIAPLDSPGFHWDDIPEEVFRRGNQPVRLVPSKWYDSLGFAPALIAEKIQSGSSRGQQIDWGSWALEVSKSDCVQIWRGCQPIRPTSHKRWRSIMEEIDALPDNNAYLLVVTELP